MEFVNKLELDINKLIKENKSVEGYITTKVVYNLIKEHNIDAPFIKMIYEVLYQNLSTEKFIKEFIFRKD